MHRPARDSCLFWERFQCSSGLRFGAFVQLDLTSPHPKIRIAIDRLLCFNCLHQILRIVLEADHDSRLRYSRIACFKVDYYW